MAPLRRILRRHSANAQGATTESPIGRLQAAAGSSDDIATNAVHGGLFCWNGVAGGIGASIGVGGGGPEGQACESSPTSCCAPHLGRSSGQWATLLRIFLARTAAEVAEFGKKAQGTVYATGGRERDEEWLRTQCGKWFTSRAGCSW